MKGYGRGYYGDEQLARTPPRRGSGWGKIALVVGVGAVIWFMWPRKSEIWRVGDAPKPPVPPSPYPEAQSSALPAALPQQAALPQHAALPAPQNTQGAESRGYPSQQAYEDAVVATAKQLQATGAQITLAPHLAHLAPRLGS